MRGHKLLKNKIFAIIITVIGGLTVPIDNDITVLMLALTLGFPLFFSKENWIL
ncbi:MAG: hypothetical protein LBR74_03700 [Eubacterium sp.]|jgi:hypothetical protein|nr:hypothetical protein [Eubacterium sp.]